MSGRYPPTDCLDSGYSSSTETLVKIYQTSRCNNPENSELETLLYLKITIKALLLYLPKDIMIIAGHAPWQRGWKPWSVRMKMQIITNGPAYRKQYYESPRILNNTK
jgi:hypothetical protein